MTARQIVRTAIRAYLRILAAAAGLAAPGRTSGSTPRRILVIRLDLLGDVLYSLAAPAALRHRYPDAEIDMVVLPYTAPFVKASGFDGQILTLDSNRIRTVSGLMDPRTWRDYIRLWRRMRARRYDVAVSLAGTTASLVAVLSGARRRIGYADEAYPFVLTDAVAGGRFDRRVKEVDYVMRLLEPLDITAPASLPAFLPSDRAAGTVTTKLAAAGVTSDAPLLVIHAGAVNGGAKRWPAEKWAALARDVRERAGANVVLTGGAADREIASEVVERSGGAAISLAGQTSLDELAELLRRADVVAGGDSGPLHLAAALNRPVVGIFGPTDPAVHGPALPAAPVRIYRKDLPCSPCYSLAATAECPLGDPICMRLVPAREVAAGTIALLRSEDELLVPKQNALQNAERRQRGDE